VAVALLSALSVLAGCSDDPEQRRGAIYRWKADPTPEHVAKIRELLDDGDRDVRATALNVLVSLRVDDAQQLALTGIGDGDRFVRSVAAKLLGDLGNSESVPVLVERLRVDTEAIVRQRAAEALTKLGGEEALAGLARGAADPEEAVRLAAVKGLRKLDPRYAVPSLERVLREDSMWEVRVQAATALGLTGDPAVLPSLEAALEDPNEFVRSAAANAIRVHAEVPPPPAPATESDTEPATANDPGDVEPAASTDGPS
jgi:HEAT repeat protein